MVILADENHVGPVVVDTQWSNVNLAIVGWSQVNMLGDEYKVRKIMRDAKIQDLDEWLWQYDRAVRANRQLAVALQSQGLNEDAARFAYRAQVLQKTVLQLQVMQSGIPFRQRMQILGAWFFFLVPLLNCRLWLQTKSQLSRILSRHFWVCHSLLRPRTYHWTHALLARSLCVQHDKFPRSWLLSREQYCA